MLERFLHWVGFGLCHQLPERSFSGGGLQLPVCARDTGIYVGFVVALLAIGILHRPSRPRDFPRWQVMALLALFVAAMGYDGVTSYAGLRTTTNDIRLLTGLLAGFAAAGVLTPILNDELWRRSDAERVLDPTWRLLVWVGLVPVTFAAVRWGAPLLGAGYPLLVTACIFLTFGAVNLAIVSMLPPFDRAAETPANLALPAIAAVALTVLEMTGAAALRQALIALASRLS